MCTCVCVCVIVLTLNQPLTHKCVHCLHRPITLYMGGLILGAICLYRHSAVHACGHLESSITLTPLHHTKNSLYHLTATSLSHSLSLLCVCNSSLCHTWYSNEGVICQAMSLSM